MINSKVGNYFVFFSSYDYLENVINIFKEKNPNQKILVQEKNLNEEDREIFLNESDYYKETSGSGFEFVYQYPGMNKVLQAAGRVIRTETDKGIVILVDNRFLHSYYKKLFPEEWEQFFIINSNDRLEKRLIEFWG